MLQPDSLEYGKRAQLSCIADLVEKRAWESGFVTLANISDWLKDTGWEVLGPYFVRDRRTAPDPLRPLTPDEAADQVMGMLEDRQAWLAGKYPYTISSGTVARREPSLVIYDCVFGVCVAHAHAIQVPADPTAVMESLVARYWGQNLTWLSVDVSGVRRGTETWEDAMDEAATKLKMDVDPTASLHSPRSQDGGVDTLAWHAWPDSRTGRIAVIVQATCGVSESWRNKLEEPRPLEWKKYLRSGIAPVRVLAVPHHVPNDVVEWLTDSDGVVLDRIRLVQHLAEASTVELQIAESVRDEALEWY